MTLLLLSWLLLLLVGQGSKHVLQLHQARLSIDSEVGRGSTFAWHFGPERVVPRDLHEDGGPAPAEAESPA